MFKVLCVNNDFEPMNDEAIAQSELLNAIKPKLYEEYTVVAEDNEGEFLEYELAEIPPANGHQYFWDARAFIPLPDDEEIEAAILDEEYRQIVNEVESA